VEKTFLDGQSRRYESTVKCRDGRSLNVISLTEPIRNENNEITAVMELAADVTEQKNLENALHESNKQLLLLFEEVPCYISVVDRDLKLVQTNRRFREDFGSGIGEHCYEVFKHRDEGCLDCPVMATFEDGQVHQSEEVVCSIRGDRINVLCYTTPIRNEQGEITQVMEMATNITEIRQLQDQLTSLGLLVGSISHGIKGMLTGLAGGIYSVNTGFKNKDDERVQKGWAMVQRNVDKIRRMILDVLYYAKEREPEFETIDAREFGTEVCELFEKKAKDSSVLFTHNFDKVFGTFSADPKAMRSLLVNILENSFEACRVNQKNDQQTVTLSCKNLPENIVFEISDNGIGMDRETRDKLFTLFFSSKGAEGTGLGLFISKKIADKHAGKILVNSKSGKGTTFRVSIPQKK